MAMSILLKLQLTFQFSRYALCLGFASSLIVPRLTGIPHRTCSQRLLTKRSSPTLRDSLQGDVVAVVDAAVVAAGGGRIHPLWMPCEGVSSLK